jgi:beta-phosphoglucomutase-like phosphatase (HAD superfamily)
MTQETFQMPALLFDLDGTLMDSVYQYVLAWHEAQEELGMSLCVWRIHRRIGMSGGLLVQAFSREIGQRLTPERVQKLQEQTRGSLRALPQSDSTSSRGSRTSATT